MGCVLALWIIAEDLSALEIALGSLSHSCLTPQQRSQVAWIPVLRPNSGKSGGHRKLRKLIFFFSACDQEPVLKTDSTFAMGHQAAFCLVPCQAFHRARLTFRTVAQVIPRYRQGHSRSARWKNTPRSRAGMCWAFRSRCRSLTPGFRLLLYFSLRIVEKFSYGAF